MKIKVSGMCVPENISAVMELGVDMVSFDFRPQSKRFVSMFSSNAGIIPDYSGWNVDGKNKSGGEATSGHGCMLSGIFADDMPQNIITRIYNYNLDSVELSGSESPIMIDNLRRTVVPDIRRKLYVIKHVCITKAEDFSCCSQFERLVDCFVFDVSMLTEANIKNFDQLVEAYEGIAPYFLSGGFAGMLLKKDNIIKDRRFVGVDLREDIEKEPGLIDLDKLTALMKMHD